MGRLNARTAQDLATKRSLPLNGMIDLEARCVPETLQGIGLSEGVRRLTSGGVYGPKPYTLNFGVPKCGADPNFQKLSHKAPGVPNCTAPTLHMALVKGSGLGAHAVKPRGTPKPQPPKFRV